MTISRKQECLPALRRALSDYVIYLTVTLL